MCRRTSCWNRAPSSPASVTTKLTARAATKRSGSPGRAKCPGAYIGPAAKATAIYLRYQLNVPDRKISQFFADFFGLKFVPASAYGFERQAVRRGLPLYEDLLEKVRSLAVAHADETSWRHDGHPYWVWYAGDDDLAVFHLDAHRSTEAAQSVLGEQLRRHPRRRRLRLLQRRPSQGPAVLPGPHQNQGQRTGTGTGPAQGPGGRPRRPPVLPGHSRLGPHRLPSSPPARPGPWRAKAAQRKARALRRELRPLCRTPLRYPKAETFRKRLVGPEQKLFFTCFRRPNVPPTNNQAERSLRPVVIMRKVVQGTRSDKGLENHSVLRSLFETARRQGNKPHHFFLDLFTKTTAQAQAALYRRPLRATRPPLRC